MGGLSFWHIIIVIMVIFLLFGRGKISDLMGDVAKGIKSFKKNMSDEDSEDKASKKKDSNSKLDH
jgi:sec-independent protein translocase protein TatA